jgi:type I restriction-modification system DNA methylase subunit
MNQQALLSFIWSVADLVRGDHKQSEYGKVILPFTVLWRLDCVLEKTKPAVCAEREKRKKAGVNPAPSMLRRSGDLLYTPRQTRQHLPFLTEKASMMDGFEFIALSLWHWLKTNDLPNWIAVAFAAVIWPVALYLWSTRRIHNVAFAGTASSRGTDSHRRQITYCRRA